MHPVGQSNHKAPSKSSVKRAARKQLASWVDADEPGLSKSAPRAAQAVSEGGEGKDGKALAVRARLPGADMAGGQVPSGSARAGQPAQAAAAPRTSLCSRAPKWPLGLAVLGMIGLAALYAGDLLPASPPPQALPDADLLPPEGQRLETTTPPAWIPVEIPQAPPWPPATPDAETPAPVTPHTLTQAIDEALAADDIHAVHALSLRLSDRWPQKGLSLEAVERLVDAYRMSRHCREARSMNLFIDGLFLAIGRDQVTDAHLERLLKVWSWRYGEAQEPQDQGGPVQTRALTHGFALNLADHLGGPSIPDSQLRLLIDAVGREPDGIRPGDLNDLTISLHADWVSAALMQVIFTVSRPPTQTRTTELAPVNLTQVGRCVQLFLRGRHQDPRWRALLMMGLHLMEGTASVRLVPEREWQDILLREMVRYLEETTPSLRVDFTIQRAVTALYDPKMLMSGRVLKY